jgi:Family of unknown function (DUF5947)
VSGDSSAYAVLARISRGRRPPVAGGRCEMCAEPIGAEHPHVVNLASRGLLCACRGCYLLFTDERAELRYRAVPDRYLAFTGLRFDGDQWSMLDIPVGLAFLFRNSVLDRWAAFYPGPAGAAESELPLASWDGVLAANPALARAVPDVEALLLRAPAAGRDAVECYLVPIDACYELVGRLRQLWRGFDGGQQARAAIEDFFATIAARARPAPAGEAA